MGAWSRRLGDARRDDGRRRLPLDRALRHGRRGRASCGSSTSPPTARSRRSRTGIAVQAGEIVDAAVMRRRALDAFLADQIADAREQGVLFSLHLKATMMKVSDPIIFGHAVRAFFADVFADHGDALQEVGASPNHGLASILTAIERLPDGPPRGDRGRDRGDLRDRAAPGDGRLRPRHHQPARPERRDRRRLDAGDDPQLGPDVERRRRAAGRQGGHPRLELRGALRRDDRVLPRARRVRPGHDGHDAERRPDGTEGRGVRQPRQDVRDRVRGHRARGRRRRARRCSSTTSSPATCGARCQTKDAPVADWVRLAVGRARATGAPAVFWLDASRPHDAEVLAKVERELAEARHRRPADRDPARRRGDALHARARRARRGHDLGHRQRAARLPHRPVPDPRAGHEREDALDRPADERRRPVRDGRRGLGAQARAAARQGEPPALGLARRVPRARRVAREGRRGGARAHARRGDGPAARRGPLAVAQRGELDNRGSHFYLALYWAQALAAQDEDAALAERFAPLAERLAADEETIVEELASVQGAPVDLGGHYFVDREKATAVMRPSRRSTPRSTASEGREGGGPGGEGSGDASPRPPAPSAARRASRRRRRRARRAASARRGGSPPSCSPIAAVFAAAGSIVMRWWPHVPIRCSTTRPIASLATPWRWWEGATKRSTEAWRYLARSPRRTGSCPRPRRGGGS